MAPQCSDCSLLLFLQAGQEDHLLVRRARASSALGDARARVMALVDLGDIPDMELRTTLLKELASAEHALMMRHHRGALPPLHIAAPSLRVWVL